MASYRILIKRSAQKEIKAAGTKKDRQLIVRRILGLALDPRPQGCEKLAGSDYYRVRQGTYRIVYEIQDSVLIVYIVKVAHRKDVYKP